MSVLCDCALQYIILSFKWNPNKMHNMYTYKYIYTKSKQQLTIVKPIIIITVIK